MSLFLCVCVCVGQTSTPPHRCSTCGSYTALPTVRRVSFSCLSSLLHTHTRPHTKTPSALLFVRVCSAYRHTQQRQCSTRESYTDLPTVPQVSFWVRFNPNIDSGLTRQLLLIKNIISHLSCARRIALFARLRVIRYIYVYMYVYHMHISKSIDIHRVRVDLSGTETKKQSPNTSARANDTLHKQLGYPVGEPAKQSACEVRP